MVPAERGSGPWPPAMIAVDAPHLAESLLAIAQAVNETNDLAESLRRVCRELARLTGAETVSAHLRDPATNALRPVAGYHMPPDLLPALSAIVLPLASEGFSGDVFQRETVVWSDDVVHDARFSSPVFRRFPHQSGVIVPLVLDDEAAGAFYLVWWQKRVRLEAPDLALLQAVARQVGTLLRMARLTRAAAVRAERQRVFLELGELLSSSLDLDVLLGAIARAAAGVTDVAAVVVWVLDEGGQTLSVRAVSDPAVERDAPFHTLGLGEGVVGRVAVERRRVTVTDLAADDRLLARGWLLGLGLRSIHAVPVLADGALVAVLTLLGRNPGPLDPDQEAVLGGFVFLAATAIRNAQLYRVATRRADRMRALAEMERLVSGTLDPRVVAQQVADTLRYLLGATATLVHELDAEAGHLRLLAVSGDVGHALRPGAVLPRGTGLVGLAIEERRLLMTADVRTDSRLTFPPEVRAGVEAASYRAVLACPLFAHGRVTGGLGVGDRAGRVFADEDLQLVQAFADQAAVALWNASLFAAERAAHAGTERALEAVREREARLQALVDDSPVGVIIHQGGLIKFANAALVDMAGYDHAEELVGQPYWILLAPSEREGLEAQRLAMLRGEVTTSRQETENVRKDGTSIWVENWASAVTWQGAPARLVTFIDITERKRAQAAVAEREAQLRQTMKMEAIGKLAGGVAHDFNNVLAVIMGYADLLRDQLPPDATLREPLDLILGAAQRAARLTRQLLAFSRKQALKPQVLDLNEAIGSLEKMLRRVIGEDVHLETRLAPDLGRTEADVGQLEQVVMNLVVNARDAMPTGGRLVVATANAVLDEARAAVLGVAAGPYVELSVQDSGVGMDDTVLAHLFEPFFTTKGPAQGTGLGLSTVYGIVRQSGGAVAVESRPGQGATFRLYFPRVAGEVTEAAPDAAREGRGAGQTLLVAEDAGEVQTLVCTILQSAGYRVLPARDGVEALAVARDHRGPIDAVITDVIMPRMGGDELARHLARVRPATPVLYISGYTDDALGQRGVLCPDVALLPKPFSADALLRAVREILERR